MKRILLSVFCICITLSSYLSAQGVDKKTTSVDVCIYGGSSAGVIAAYTAKKQGKTVLLIEPRKNLGGLSSGGLGYTDIGNKFAVQGLGLDFYRRIGKHYGKLEQWVFEPHVAEGIFNDYIREANVEVWFGKRIIKANKKNNQIEEIILEDTYNPKNVKHQKVKAKVFIDCTYEGDLMARSGVSYTVGRESNDTYGESINGVQMRHHHQFKADIDPYKIPGDPSSGLLWGISDEKLAPAGTGDKKVQAYNFRICLTEDPNNRIPITKPENYDPSKYELLIRLKEKQPWKKLADAFIWSMMPNRKTDINNRGAFSTDMIGGNWNYPEASYEEREKIFKEHIDYTKGLLYFVGNDERIPEHIRSRIKDFGYPKDEYVNNGHWSPQLYIREARRMIGEVVMTQHHCQGKEVVKDGIGWAAYMMDSHNCQRLVVDGKVRNEGDVQVGGFPPYPISYRAITPKEKEANNLLVPVCLSSSHIAFGSIRMEPVFMVLGQSAATAACMAIDKANNIVQQIDVTALQQELKNNPLADRSVASIVIDNEDSQNISMKGNWKIGKQKTYGLSNRYDDSRGKVDKTFRFTPEIKKEGEYEVYYYFPRQKKPSSIINFNINDGKKITNKVLDIKKIKILGQTSGEWVLLGKFNLQKGKDAYVEVHNKDANGTVVADAILFHPTFK